MPGEDQERFEDYLELERYIEALQEGRVAHPPSDLTPSQARIYRAAALFRSATPEAATPRPEFVEELRARLLDLDQTADEEDTLKIPRVKAEDLVATPQTVDQGTDPGKEHDQASELVATPRPMEQDAAAGEEHDQTGEQENAVPPTPVRKNTPRRARFFSRRSVLTGSAVAAASLVVGTGIGAISERSASSFIANTAPTPTYDTGTGSYGKMPLVEDGAGTWHYVGTVDEIGENAIRFVTETLVGYVIRSDGDQGEKKNEIIAMSAACTHMGCIVQWQASDHQFHCPCHDGVFTEYGKPSPDGKLKYLAPLPRMKTMIGDNGEVYVYVPKIAP
jgi:Rieske Fe-S protein